MTLWENIKCAFGRLFASGVPSSTEEKIFGDEGEREFCEGITKALRKATVKQNVLLFGRGGEYGELDFLIEYDDRLFAVEVKRWNGKVIISDDGVKHYNSRGELTSDKDPFRQVSRTVGLLKNVHGVRGYIDGIVYFGGEARIDCRTDDRLWFDDVKELAKYIKRADGDRLPARDIDSLMRSLTCADFIFSQSLFGDREKRAHIVSPALVLDVKGTRNVKIDFKDIYALEIRHGIVRDGVRVVLKNGKKLSGESFGTQNIRVREYKSTYDIAINKIDGIVMGN